MTPPQPENGGKTADEADETDNEPDDPAEVVNKADEPDEADAADAAAEMITDEDVVPPPLRCPSPHTRPNEDSPPELMDGADLIISHSF